MLSSLRFFFCIFVEVVFTSDVVVSSAFFFCMTFGYLPLIFIITNCIMMIATAKLPTINVNITT